MFKQLVGGPIGSRLTMAVSKIVMTAWGNKLRNILSAAYLEIYLEFCYVDDLRYIVSLLPPYITWDTKNKRWEDSRSSQATTAHTSPPTRPQGTPLTGKPAHNSPTPNTSARLHEEEMSACVGLPEYPTNKVEKESGEDSRSSQGPSNPPHKVPRYPLNWEACP